MSIYYKRLAERSEAVWAGFTEAQLRTVVELARRSNDISAEEVAHTRTLPQLKPIRVS